MLVVHIAFSQAQLLSGLFLWYLKTIFVFGESHSVLDAVLGVFSVTDSRLAQCEKISYFNRGGPWGTEAVTPHKGRTYS